MCYLNLGLFPTHAKTLCLWRWLFMLRLTSERHGKTTYKYPEYTFYLGWHKLKKFVHRWKHSCHAISHKFDRSPVENPESIGTTQQVASWSQGSDACLWASRSILSRTCGLPAHPRSGETRRKVWHHGGLENPTQPGKLFVH